MKQITVLSILLLLLFSEQSIAQKSVEVEYEQVSYLMNHHPISYYHKLFASKDLSVSRLESVGKREESSLEAKEDGTLTYTASLPKPSVRSDLYVDINKGVIRQVTTNQGQTRQIDDTPPSLDWQITDESKEIGGYIAIKAEMTFRGRDFEAWFTPEIPIPAGPWKFYGLPGLILEVKDEENKNLWYARNIKYPAEFDINILNLNSDEVDEVVSLQEALKLQLDNQSKEEKLKKARANQQGYKIIETTYPSRESWLERGYEWE